MRMVPVCWRALASGAALALALSPVTAPAAPAAPTAPEKDAAVVNPVEKLRKDLDKTISLKIDNLPLNAAIEALRKQTNIPIVFDGVTIQQQLGYTPDQAPVPVAVELKDVKVRTALRTILAPYNLGYAPIGGAVIITTEDMAMSRQLRQCISVDMEKVAFAAALKQISRDTAVNLVLDARVAKDAEAKVTLHLEDVPLDTAVRLLAEMAGLKPVRIGSVLFVTSKQTADELRQDPDVANPNAALRAQELQLQQLQLQLGAMPNPGLGFNPGGVGPGLGVAAPPGVPPAVPPVEAPKENKNPPDDSAPKDPPPADVKPLTK